MRNYVQRLCECKLGKFFIKYHIFYLILPIALWGFKALSYNIAIWIDPPTRYFHFTIDDKIPFIKYFFVFYFSYYLEAMNCFPSLHAIVGMCLVSIGAYIPKLDKKGLPKAFRIISIIIGIGCILSTIFIKQHYFIDMIAGVILEVVSLGSLYIAFELYAKTKRKSGSCKEKGEEV